MKGVLKVLQDATKQGIEFDVPRVHELVNFSSGLMSSAFQTLIEMYVTDMSVLIQYPLNARYCAIC